MHPRHTGTYYVKISTTYFQKFGVQIHKIIDKIIILGILKPP